MRSKAVCLSVCVCACVCLCVNFLPETYTPGTFPRTIPPRSQLTVTGHGLFVSIINRVDIRLGILLSPASDSGDNFLPVCSSIMKTAHGGGGATPKIYGCAQAAVKGDLYLTN